jgi:hypothetical protein
VRKTTLRLIATGLVLRYATMAAILFAPGVSFWSRYRMLGELGPMLVMSVLAAASLIALERAPSTTDEKDLVASPSRT